MRAVPPALLASHPGPPRRHQALRPRPGYPRSGLGHHSPAAVRGQRTLVISRKGGKVVTIPLAPRTARAIDLAVGERVEGPVFLTPTDSDWTDMAPPGCSPGDPPRGDHQAGPAAHVAARVHHHGARRRGPVAGRPGSRLTCRSPDHHALRPRRRQPAGTRPYMTCPLALPPPSAKEAALLRPIDLPC
jgi:hypothetical protein